MILSLYSCSNLRPVKGLPWRKGDSDKLNATTLRTSLTPMRKTTRKYPERIWNWMRKCWRKQVSQLTWSDRKSSLKTWSPIQQMPHSSLVWVRSLKTVLRTCWRMNSLLCKSKSKQVLSVTTPTFVSSNPVILSTINKCLTGSDSHTCWKKKTPMLRSWILKRSRKLSSTSPSALCRRTENIVLHIIKHWINLLKF